jgi:polyhydroxybutyrate depolymerase
MRRLLAALLLLPGCRSLEQHTIERRMEFGGARRMYLLHVPPNIARPAPVVLMFHGGGGDALSAEMTATWSRLSDEEGFIVVYPEGLERNWHDGRLIEPETGRDDVAFVAAILDDLMKEHEIDPKRVYSTGISNGGFFSNYLAARLSARIAAIAPVVGGIREPFHREFKPEHPVSVLLIMGTDDPLVPFEGGPVAKNRGSCLSAAQSARMWHESNGCRPEPVKDELDDKDRSDGCRVKRSTWSGGKNGTEVVLLTIEGGGHTWPDGGQYLPKALIGPVCRDLDTRWIWEWLKAHARP